MDSMVNTVIQCQGAAYWVQKLIGEGRFSRVYKATDTCTNERVAIKTLNRAADLRSGEIPSRDKERAEMDVLRELRSSPLKDRYVRLVNTVWLHTGSMCFVTEQLGVTLQSVLHNIGPLPMSICRPVVRQLVQGLTGLRLMGIVHADLKPDNIMFSSGMNNCSPQVKIIDFGWAFHAKDAFAMHKKKLQAVPYRAPEVCFGASDLGHGLDVWALGCIMPEIVTGVKLFGVVDEERLIGLMVRALRVPDSLKAHPVVRMSSGDAVPLTTGWIRFKKLYRNTLRGVDGDKQKNEDIVWFADLTYKMLTMMPHKRIAAVDALSHPFLTMVHFIKYPCTKMTKINAEIMNKCKLPI